MTTSDFFAGSYNAARKRFLAAASAAGAQLRSFPHPFERDPQGHALAIDVALLGPPDATRCLLITSGTHGVEGFAGSGCQVGFFQNRLHEALPSDACAVVVHAINPYGFAWLRRVNEDNVDLNRNFQDFSRPLPRSDAYRELHELLIPQDWDSTGRREADAGLQQHMATYGLAAFQAAVSAGQYTHPTGMFYGGTAETWSARTFKSILATLIPRTVMRLIALDLHTGLGPTGYGEPIFVGGGARDFERSVAYFGPEVVNMAAGTSVSAIITGSIANAVVAWSPQCEVTFLTLEFGTKPLLEVLTALRGDHWLHAAARPASPLAEQIARNLRDAFYVDTSSWQEAIYGRTADFVGRAARALAMP
jgi:Protein of unknown function (DUF2817)